MERKRWRRIKEADATRPFPQKRMKAAAFVLATFEEKIFLPKLISALAAGFHMRRIGTHAEPKQVEQMYQGVT